MWGGAFPTHHTDLEHRGLLDSGQVLRLNSSMLLPQELAVTQPDSVQSPARLAVLEAVPTGRTLSQGPGWRPPCHRDGSQIRIS